MPVGVAYGYFGPLTQAAVAKWQAANGVMPAAGYWGPISRAKANTMAGAPTTPTTPGSGISTPGVEGNLVVTETSADTDGEISSGQDKVGILGLELEADLSDIRVERIEVNLGSDRDIYRDVADRIYVMHGSTVLASRDLNSSTVIENSDGDYIVTISGINLVVREGDEEVVVIALDAQSTIDSDQEGSSFTVEIPVDGVRGVDGAGINQYAPSTAISESFTVEALAGGDLDITESSDNPESGIVFVDEDNNTDDVLVLAFELDADDQDLIIDSIPVRFVVTENDGVDGPVRRAVLKNGSTVLDTVTIPSSATTTSEILFDDLDLALDEGDSVELMVYVDLNDADISTFATTTTLVASVSATPWLNWDVEDAEGDDATISGSATGGTMTFYVGGLSANLTDSDEVAVLNLDSTNADNQGQYTIRLNVTAEEETAWIALTAASSTSADSSNVGVAFYMEDASTGSAVMTGTTTATLSQVSGGTVTGGYVRVNPGQTTTLELVVYHDAAATGIFRVQLDSVGFNQSSEAAPNQEITLTPESDFESGSIQVLE
jgi:peptidoglycan hydrolase-like protein with peptidoglycan-binding domain